MPYWIHGRDSESNEIVSPFFSAATSEEEARAQATSQGMVVERVERVAENQEASQTAITPDSVPPGRETTHDITSDLVPPPLELNDSVRAANELPVELQARAQSELTSDERLVWTGQPQPHSVLYVSLFLVLFGLILTIVTAWFAMHWLETTDDFNRHWNQGPGVRSGFFEKQERSVADYVPFLFVVVGIGIMTVPLFLLRQVRSTFYLLTDKRAIICQAGLFGDWTTFSYPGGELRILQRHERANGSGSLVFEVYTTLSPDSEGRSRRRTHWRGFLNVANVRQVEALVRSTLQVEK
jgi:hypothetical protein